MMLKILSFSSLLLFFSATNAQEAEFLFKHPTCEVKITNQDDRLQALFISKLKERGYQAVLLSNERPLFEGDLYGSFKREHLDGKIFKECKVEITIKQALRNLGGVNDQDIFTHSTVRALPRITFKGHERCSRALKDVFVHLPPCQHPSKP